MNKRLLASITMSVLLVALIAATAFEIHNFMAMADRANRAALAVPLQAKVLPVGRKPASPAPVIMPTPDPTAAAQSTSANQTVPSVSSQSVPSRRPIVTPTPALPVNSAVGMTATELQVARQLFNQINQDRAAQGLPAYTLNNALVNSAYKHDIRMAETSCGLAHQCSGEADLGMRISAEGLNWMSCGENIGYATARPDAWTATLQYIHEGMMGEQPPNDGHRLNLLSQSFHQIGIGVHLDAKGLVWVTEDFSN